ncbi:MAG TPA: periplasmic heavy metal sensor [Pyrinomonadaceae bacterium]|jgi:Spy/CpxP family protein refolding chaperone|nr:periplasmic heavy metal sensor [Pyrinomonadaceae bacterium]
MKTKTTDVLTLLLTIIFILAGTLVSVQAQTATQQPPTQDATQTQTTQAPNLQSELGLKPDQIQKWRALNQELRPQEVAGTMKVREAKRALAEAMEAPTPNEDLIKQRAKELADAQSVMTQLQALRQARVLQILTPDQRIKLKEIRERNQALRRGNQQQQNVNGLNQRQQQRLKKQNDPLLTPAERRAVRRQQKPLR